MHFFFPFSLSAAPKPLGSNLTEKKLVFLSHFLKQLLGDLTFCVDPDCMQPNTKIPIVLGNSITNEDKERLLLRCIFRV